jgi:hypothetical protein
MVADDSIGKDYDLKVIGMVKKVIVITYPVLVLVSKELGKRTMLCKSY